MKVYAQFLELDLKGNIAERLGSDGVYILDGRNNSGAWIMDAKNRMHQLRYVAPCIIGFDIIKASRFGEGIRAYRWIKPKIKE